jgi:hypothetical protein
MQGEVIPPSININTREVIPPSININTQGEVFPPSININTREMSDCLTPTQQFFRYSMARTS